jgi:hypothetical protein
MEAGTVKLEPCNGDVRIIITLNEGRRFEDVEENVKVQGYSATYTGRTRRRACSRTSSCDASPFSECVPLPTSTASMSTSSRRCLARRVTDEHAKGEARKGRCANRRKPPFGWERGLPHGTDLARLSALLPRLHKSHTPTRRLHFVLRSPTLPATMHGTGHIELVSRRRSPRRPASAAPAARTTRATVRRRRLRLSQSPPSRRRSAPDAGGFPHSPRPSRRAPGDRHASDRQHHHREPHRRRHRRR